MSFDPSLLKLGYCQDEQNIYSDTPAKVLEPIVWWQRIFDRDIMTNAELATNDMCG
jgi:hypothetical protein